METLSLNCTLATVSISFSLPLNIIERSQREPENEAVFLDEIQLHRHYGIHKSSKFSPLEFSQNEIVDEFFFPLGHQLTRMIGRDFINYESSAYSLGLSYQLLQFKLTHFY